jgi:hypothetical protein
MLAQQQIEFSAFSGLYDLIIPKDNLLRKINELIDFTFIYEELVDKYCPDNGRTAESPIRMFKYLLLKRSILSRTLMSLTVRDMICPLNISLTCRLRGKLLIPVR